MNIASILACLAVLSALSVAAIAQTAPTTLPDAPSYSSSAPTVAGLLPAILHDQVAELKSPAHIRAHDLAYLIPIAGATAAALATDPRANRDVVSHDPSFNSDSVNASNALVGGFIAAPAALFLIGHHNGDEHAREAGLLGAEAMGDSLIAATVVKLIFFRERPYADNYQGEFFIPNSGANSSFLSTHSTIAWSSAAVLAAEYPSPWKQATLYTLATGVSLTRVMGEQHFPSDVLVGAASGWLIGHYVYRRHHHDIR